MASCLIWPQNNHRRLLTIFLIFFTAASIMLNVAFCTSSTSWMYNYFGSKTTYNTAAPVDWKHVLAEARLAPSCKLFHIRMVARHGTRSPDAKNIEGVKKALKRLAEASALQSPVTREQSELRSAILAWKSILPDGKRLMQRGKDENTFLARNFYKLITEFSTIFKQKFAFNFHSTEIARSYESGVAFRDEFVKLVNSINITLPFYLANVSKNDDILYLHKNCPAFVARVEKSNITSAETKRVRLTPEAVALVDKINKARFGLPENSLDWNNIFALYQMAAFEVANSNSSILLQLFDESDLEFLEYSDELDNYWKKAYGHPMIADLSCVLTRNIFDTALRKTSRPEYDGIFEFAHLETLLPVYAAFDLYRDQQEDFVASAPRDFIRNRQFKTSVIAPFAANIAFLFFVCPDSEEQMRNEHRVMFLVNGKIVPLSSACPDVSCPLQIVREAYSAATPNCNLKDLCRLESDGEDDSENRRSLKSCASSNNNINNRRLLFCYCCFVFQGLLLLLMRTSLLYFTN